MRWMAWVNYLFPMIALGKGAMRIVGKPGGARLTKGCTSVLQAQPIGLLISEVKLGSLSNGE